MAAHLGALQGALLTVSIIGYHLLILTNSGATFGVLLIRAPCKGLSLSGDPAMTSAALGALLGSLFCVPCKGLC